MIKLAKMNIQLFAEPGEGDPTNGNGEPNTTPDADDVKKYLETIEKLKTNSVSKEEADKLREENRILLDKIVKGGGVPVPQPEVKDWHEEAKEFTKTLAKEGINDYEYAKAAVGLRNLYLEHEKVDIFTNTDGQADYTVQVAAQNVADHMEDCIKECDGDPDIFKTLFLKKIK